MVPSEKSLSRSLFVGDILGHLAPTSEPEYGGIIYVNPLRKADPVALQRCYINCLEKLKV